MGPVVHHSSRGGPAPSSDFTPICYNTASSVSSSHRSTKHGPGCATCRWSASRPGCRWRGSMMSPIWGDWITVLTIVTGTLHRHDDPARRHRDRRNPQGVLRRDGPHLHMGRNRWSSSRLFGTSFSSPGRSASDDQTWPQLLRATAPPMPQPAGSSSQRRPQLQPVSA